MSASSRASSFRPSLRQTSEFEWRLDPVPGMRAEAVVFGGEDLVRGIEAEALRQLMHVACLPGLAGRVCALPDTHSGYGFPIGCVAAMRPGDGVVSAGGVGFDIACGVRTLLTDLDAADVVPRLEDLAEALYRAVPSGVGARGGACLDARSLDAVLAEGAAWAVAEGYGTPADLTRIEWRGRLPGAKPEAVSREARGRGESQLGTLGSSNHYLEVQAVEELLDPHLAAGFGLRQGQVVISAHCGSRGLGHQTAMDYASSMTAEAPRHGISLPDKNLACAPISSDLGRAYLGAMRAAANFALANRQIIGHAVRQAVRHLFSEAGAMPLLYDVSHNLCSEERHALDGSGRSHRLFIHRKGATRALPPGHPELPADLAAFGQPVPVGGSMGTASYILAGTSEAEVSAWGSACHGAGRVMSRSQAKKQWIGKDILSRLRHKGIFVRTGSIKEVAEEAPGAYKDISAVIKAVQGAGLATAVARLRPLACVKG